MLINAVQNSLKSSVLSGKTSASHLQSKFVFIIDD